MTINKTTEEKKLCIALQGRLDTTTAPDLEAEIQNSIAGIEELTLDFSELEYISSAGLRVLLMAQKAMANRGTMIVKNVNSSVMEVFEITGFSDILTIK